LVVDSSVLVSALVEQGPIGTWAELVVAEGELVAPEIALVETTDVLRRLERASLITSDEANAAQAGLLVLDVLLYPFAPFADRVWALQANLTVKYSPILSSIDPPNGRRDRIFAIVNFYGAGS